MDKIRELVCQRAFSGNNEAERKIREKAAKAGLWLDSIYYLYEEMSAGKVGGFTVPAINIRTLTFDIARLIFRLMKKMNAGPVIFELARSEIGYTNQFIGEYATVILGAGLVEKYRGPIFVQGDHFQVNAKKYFGSDSERNHELAALEALVLSAIQAGVYNIDIDASTLVRLDEKKLSAQQAHNCKVTSGFVKLIRNYQPKGTMVAIGGEIGEIGGKNSTTEELEVFVSETRKLLPSGLQDMSKVSPQTGTSHGGVVMPDGSLLRVKVDFDALARLSQKAREMGFAGVVQHGASTLPLEYFDKFPEAGCVEIHLATEFQNIVLKYLPQDLVFRMYQYCKDHFASQRKPTDSEEQFIYQTREKVLGPFKQELWDLPSTVKERILAELKEKFAVLFEKLKITGTRKIIDELYRGRGR